MAKVALRPRYQTMDGITFPSLCSPDCFRQALTYKPKLGDTFILTYPKCGTTWMQHVVLYTYRKGRELEDHRDFLRMCPFMDAFGNEGLERMPQPGAFKTHIPFDRVPYSPEAKYIIVLRNPKDCVTSFYCHTKTNPGFGYWDATFDDFFELFMAGEVEYNDYFDHMMSWYPHRNDKQVFFTTYEDMKRNTKDIVHRVADFLGKEYVEAIEKDNNVLNNILSFSSFEYMKKHFSWFNDFTNVSDEQMSDPNTLQGFKHMVQFAKSLNPPDLGKFQFLRKGVVGDWKTHLSAEQSERLSKKFLKRTRGTEILDLYKDYI